MRCRFILVLALGLISIEGLSQLNQSLFDAHAKYKHELIKDRRFKHEDIVSILSEPNPNVQVKQVGESVEGRSINMTMEDYYALQENIPEAINTIITPHSSRQP